MSSLSLLSTRSDKDNKLAITTKEETEEEEEHSEEVSVCQSPISVNSHLQCRASSVDLSLPIAAMQEAGLTPEDIKSQKYASFLSFERRIAVIYPSFVLGKINRTLLLIMREMIQTERDYVRSLEYIIEVTVTLLYSTRRRRLRGHNCCGKI